MAGPVQIDPVNGGEFTQQYANFQQGPFLVGMNLYTLLSTATTLEMFLSTDGGATWLLQDSGAQPSDPDLNGGACWFDGTHTVWVAYSASGGGPAPINIQTFDTGTNTWSAPVGGSGPTVQKVNGCCLRSDGTLFVCSQVDVVPGTNSGLEVDIYDTGGGGWTGTYDLAADILTLPEYSVNVSAFNPVFAPDAMLDYIYAFYMTSDTSGTAQMNNGVFYVRFSLGNTRSNFFVFPGQIGTPSQPDPQMLRCDNGPFMGPPAVCGPGIIVLGVAATSGAGGTGNYASIYVTTDSGVTWTFDDAPDGIDPGVTPTAFDSAQFAPFVSWDGTHLYVVYAQLHSFIFPAPSLRLSVTVPDFMTNPDTWTFTASTVENITSLPGQVEGTNGFSFPKLTFSAGHPLLSSDVSDIDTGDLTAWFLPISFTAAGGLYGTFVGILAPGHIGGGTK